MHQKVLSKNISSALLNFEYSNISFSNSDFISFLVKMYTQWYILYTQTHLLFGKFLVFAILFLVTSSLKLPIQYSIVDCRIMPKRYIQTYFRFFFLFSTDHAHKGNLYTLFLHSPMSAFCFVTNVVDIPIHLWDKCLAYIDRFMTEASRLITRCRGVGKSMKQNKCWILIHRSIWLYSPASNAGI